MKPELPKRNTADRQNLYWEALGRPTMRLPLSVAMRAARLAAKARLGTTRELR